MIEPPVTVKELRAVAPIALENVTVPVPAETVRDCEPATDALIALANDTALFVVARVALPDRVIEPVPFCVIPLGPVIVTPPIVHTPEFVTVIAPVAVKLFVTE